MKPNKIIINSIIISNIMKLISLDKLINVNKFIQNYLFKKKLLIAIHRKKLSEEI